MRLSFIPSWHNGPYERSHSRLPLWHRLEGDRTQALTELALEAGFRAIDTANQRRHYFEAGVGLALRSAFDSGRLRRDELFLQTKFTYQRGQDHRLPYDPQARLREQVEQSVASSLEHLGTAWVDSLLLHGPASLWLDRRRCRSLGGDAG